MKLVIDPNLLDKMRRDWDARARQNPLFYVNTAQVSWTDEEFFRSGFANVSDEILTDMDNICQGKPPREMRILEIGCGAGRMTRALAEIFGEVHAVDVSGEMIRLAREKLAGVNNVFLYQNSGSDLAVVPRLPFDFAFSFIVFQHIPSKAVLENYAREAYRLLRDGALFKFQVQGITKIPAAPDDTWTGAGLSLKEVRRIAKRCSFDLRFWSGEGTQYFRIWFFKVGAR